MDFVKLTQQEGITAGKQIMTDPRCTPEIKREVSVLRMLRAAHGGFLYTCSSANGKKNEWYDDIMIANGVDNSAK